MVSGVDEDQIQHPDPAQLVQLLAEAKASAVKLKVEQSAELSPSIKAVLGCDSVLAFEGKVFGKPVDAAEVPRRKRLTPAARHGQQDIVLTRFNG